MKIVLAGGGTGGHAFPAVAIAEELKRREPDAQLLYLGNRGSIEERIAGQRAIPFRPIQVEGFAGGPLKMARALLKTGIGLLQSLAILSKYRPDAVIGTGGYASLPPVAAAGILRIPALIHEQNSIPGKANRICSRFADVVAIHFEKSRQYFSGRKVMVAGNPIRADFSPQRVQAMKRAEARKKFGLKPDRFTAFVFGGSRGAHSLNVAVVDALRHLDADRFQLIFMTGKDDFQWAHDACDRAGITAAVFPFIDEMVTAYCAADLAVCRAGASTIAELAAVALPAVLVPYPYAAEGHQELNARALVEAGAAMMVLNGDLRGDRLAEKLVSLANDPGHLEALRAAVGLFAVPDAAERIVNALLELLSERGIRPHQEK